MYMFHRLTQMRNKSKIYFGIAVFCIYIGLLTSFMFADKHKYVKVFGGKFLPLKSLQDMSRSDMNITKQGGDILQSGQKHTTFQSNMVTEGTRLHGPAIPRILHQTWKTTYIPK